MKSKRSKSTVETGTTPLTRPALAFFRGRSAPASSPVPCHTEPYVGRFAPSPTGPLHFGSLLGALASFLDARAHDGRWLVRIEDIDPPREVPGSTQTILDCLQAHGLNWDEPVLHQSQRMALYRGACSQLLDRGHAFFCTCSRTDSSLRDGVYSGRCRGCTVAPAAAHAIRLRIDAVTIGFDDAVQGHVEQNLGEVGDFVIFRKEQLPAYQLAVVFDDAAQGVTHIVRGSDLLDSTPRQIFLQRCLRSSQLQQPNHVHEPLYAHIPVIVNAQGQKLSKQTFATALSNAEAGANLRAALDFLGQPTPPSDLGTAPAILQWATRHWNIARIPRQRQLDGAQVPPSCRRFAT